MEIRDLCARQIFDSRGVPTLEVRAELADGSAGIGSAPSGASTGSHEAKELRDGGDAYGGKGVRRAIENVNGAIREAITGMDAADQTRIDERLGELDGTMDKSKLGGNALIAVSWAVADAAAQSSARHTSSPGFQPAASMARTIHSRASSSRPRFGAKPPSSPTAVDSPASRSSFLRD